MSHTYTSALFHCVFSTAERRRAISPEVQADLWAYMGGIARQHGMRPLAIGGVEDHAHLLLALPASLAVAEAMRTIKAVSSHWMHEQRGQRLFAWQQGYGAFSVGVAQVSATIAYIERQQSHHQRQDFQQEFLAILERHRIECDPRHVWG